MRFTEPLHAVQDDDGWTIRGKAPMTGGYGPIRAHIVGKGAKAKAIAERLALAAKLEEAAGCVVATLEYCERTGANPSLPHLLEHCRNALAGRPTP